MEEDKMQLEWTSVPAYLSEGLQLRKVFCDQPAGTKRVQYLFVRREDLPTLRRAVRETFGDGVWPRCEGET